MRTIVLVLCALLAFSGVARAWGPEGHQVVASFAAKDLTPTAEAAIAELLKGERDPDNRSLAAIANWADAVRPFRPETAGWHFVDIPVSATRFNAQRDCAAGIASSSKLAS